MNLPSSVNKVISLEGDDCTTIYEKKGKGKKKASRGLRAVEEAAYQTARARSAADLEYLKRHRRSNRKDRDGWLLDYPGNVFKATRKGRKKIKVEKILGL